MFKRKNRIGRKTKNEKFSERNKNGVIYNQYRAKRMERDLENAEDEKEKQEEK